MIRTAVTVHTREYRERGWRRVEGELSFTYGAALDSGPPRILRDQRGDYWIFVGTSNVGDLKYLRVEAPVEALYEERSDVPA